MSETDATTDLVGITVEIVSAYVSNNAVPAGDLDDLIRCVHATLLAVSGGPALPALPAQEPLQPAVPIRKSITPDYLVCLEDGKTFKSLKRYLRARYNLSPEQYRAKWDLPPDYPMVAPNYAKARSELAKAIGLGHPRRGSYDEAA